MIVHYELIFFPPPCSSVPLDFIEHNGIITKVFKFETLASLFLGALKPLLFQVLNIIQFVKVWD